MAMLYRHHVSFAMGHGVSVHAETLPDDPTCAVRLSTCVAPTYDVPLTEAPTSSELPAMDGLVLDMKQLAESTAPELSAALQPLTTAYENWIHEQEHRLASVDDAMGVLPTSDLADIGMWHTRRLLNVGRHWNAYAAVLHCLLAVMTPATPLRL